MRVGILSFEAYPAEDQLRNYAAAPPRRKPLSQYEAARLAAIVLHSYGTQPSPGKIQAILGRTVTHDLNGQMCKGYADAMVQLGYTHQVGPKFGNRWRKSA